MCAPSVCLIALVALTTSPAALAASCLDEAREIATQYALSAEPSNAGADRPMTGSGGSGGNTSEPVTPPSPAWGVSDIPVTGSQADPHHLSVATRTEAEALLQSAREADATGKPGECFRRVREAETAITGEGG